MRRLLAPLDDFLQRVWFALARRWPGHDQFGRYRGAASGRGRTAAAAFGFAAVVVVAFFALRQWTSSSGASTADSTPPSIRASAPPAAPVITATPTPAGPPTENEVRIDIIRESRFAWPAVGNLTSYFGQYHPNGIDIGLDPSVDSPIRASAAGTITFAGGDPCCVYGEHVIIDHGDGISTLYAHMSRVDVTEGQQVEQGDLLGLGGATGDATGKHLHFEIDTSDGPVDPLRYLPLVQASPPLNALESLNCPTAPIKLDPASQVTLAFGSGSLAAFHIGDAKLAATGNVYFPTITVTIRGQLELVLDVPAAPSASGQTVGFNLEVTFAKDNDSRVFDCPLTLTTRQTLANPPPPTPIPGSSGGGDGADAGPPPPPTLTPTPTEIRPFTPSPRPATATSTPRPASPTSSAAQSTPAPGKPTATPAKK